MKKNSSPDAGRFEAGCAAGEGSRLEVRHTSCVSSNRQRLAQTPGREPVRVPVVLLQPPGMCRAFTSSHSCYPPLGLCQLAAVARPGQVKVVDGDGHAWSDDRTADEIERLHPAVVGMTLTVGTSVLVERWSRWLRSCGMTVVLGGPQPTLDLAGSLASCPSADYFFRGEAESVFGELCDRAARAQPLEPLPGLFRRGSALSDVESPVRLSNLDALPAPLLDGIPLDGYRCPDARERPIVTMSTSRGCANNCAFCASPALHGRKIRHRGVPQVLDDIEALARRNGVREISFVDDNFTVSGRRTIELCRGMLERGLHVSWFCNARADSISMPIAEVMAAAGCHQVYMGFESGSQKILDSVDKRLTIEQLERAACILKEAGIDRSIGFVIGLPGEDEESIAATSALVHRVRPERVQFTQFTPLPGSPLGHLRSSTATSFHSGGGVRVAEWVKRLEAEHPKIRP